jgi:hypothetical protein
VGGGEDEEEHQTVGPGPQLGNEAHDQPEAVTLWLHPPH